MNKILSATLLFALVLFVGSCSNGDYTTNPDSSANGSINPLNPLTSSQFTWANTGVMGGDINGSAWAATNGYYALDTAGANVLQGINGSTEMVLYLTNVWGPNVYNMGFKIYDRYAVLVDSIDGIGGTYFSNLGNSGEVKITENDSAYIRGLFYFQGITATGKLVNVTNGYFNIPKL